ncbi:MAG: O-antigen ligase family protein [Flavobacteriales bacterium]
MGDKKSLYIIIPIILSMFCYFIYTEQLVGILILIGICISFYLLPIYFFSSQKLLYTIAFLTPLSFDIILGGSKISFPNELLMMLALVFFCVKVLSGYKLNTSIFRHPMSVIIYLFLFWMILTSIFSVSPLVSIKRTIMQCSFYLAFYFLLLHAFTSTKSFTTFFQLYIFGCIIPIIKSLISHSTWNFAQEASLYVSMPFFDEHTLYAACLAFVIPFILIQIGLTKKFIMRSFQMVLSILFILALYFSYSRAAWISLILSAVFYLFIRLKIQFWQINMILISSALALSYYSEPIYSSMRENNSKYDDNAAHHLTSVTNLRSDASNLERINRWVCAYRMFLEKPVTGFGPGTYQFEYGAFQTNEFTTRISSHDGTKGNAHSEFFGILSEMGLPGLFTFIILVFYSIKLGLKNIYDLQNKNDVSLATCIILGLITFYCHGLFNSFIDSSKISILVIGSMATLVFLDLKNRPHGKQY